MAKFRNSWLPFLILPPVFYFPMEFCQPGSIEKTSASVIVRMIAKRKKVRESQPGPVKLYYVSVMESGWCWNKGHMKEYH